MRTLLRTQLRTMNEGDLAQIADIERESFASMWPQTAYRRELGNSAARYYVVCEVPDGRPADDGEPRNVLRSLGRLFRPPAASTDEHVLGFIGLWLMIDEAHIVTFAVRETHRRMGIGERLLLEAYDCALDHDQNCLTLEVRRSNEAAQLLYAKYGMENVGTRVRYYTDNNEDAVIMTSPRLADPSHRAEVERLRAEHKKRFPDLWP